jgi:hypothetical protein
MSESLKIEMFNIFDALLMHDPKNAAWVRSASVWDRAFSAYLLQIVCDCYLLIFVTLSRRLIREICAQTRRKSLPRTRFRRRFSLNRSFAPQRRAS